MGYLSSSVFSCLSLYNYNYYYYYYYDEYDSSSFYLRYSICIFYFLHHMLWCCC